MVPPSQRWTGSSATPPDPIEAERYAARVEALWDDPLLDAPGVLHGVAAWSAPDAPLQVIAIGPASPVSSTDRFALEVSRARADAILTTGRILRAEPELRIELSHEAMSWRALRLGKPRPPRVAVLTSGRDLWSAHPLLSSASPVLIVTDRSGTARLARQRFPTPPQILAAEPGGLRDAIACVRRELAADTLSIEAGPLTSAALYGDPLVVDELMLSLFEAPALPPTLRAGALPPLAELERLLPVSSRIHRVAEASGPWSFRRLRRAGSA